jgi:hypothetical protein
MLQAVTGLPAIFADIDSGRSGKNMLPAAHESPTTNIL